MGIEKGSLIRRRCCSFKAPKFGSQHPHDQVADAGPEKLGGCEAVTCLAGY